MVQVTTLTLKFINWCWNHSREWHTKTSINLARLEDKCKLYHTHLLWCILAVTVNDSVHYSATTFTVTKLCISSHSLQSHYQLLTWPSIILLSSASKHMYFYICLVCKGHGHNRNVQVLLYHSNILWTTVSQY